MKIGFRQNNCLICMEKLKILFNTIQCGCCQKSFHSTCLKTWCEINSVCPHCRANMNVRKSEKKRKIIFSYLRFQFFYFLANLFIFQHKFFFTKYQLLFVPMHEKSVPHFFFLTELIFFYIYNLVRSENCYCRENYYCRQNFYLFIQLESLGLLVYNNFILNRL